MTALTTPEQDAAERAAMRAFLQRAEVRLSTMHRVVAIIATALLLFHGSLRLKVELAPSVATRRPLRLASELTIIS